jgi:uncharacterized protein (DUF2147 family)
MRKYLLLGLLIVLSIQTVFSATANDMSSPVGAWKTVDDVTGRVLAIIQIAQLPDGSLAGTLIKTFPLKSDTETHICSLCDKKDPRYNKPYLGMTILTGFKYSGKGTLWTDGNVLDPKRGSVYRCQLRVVDGGKKLNVRGYIGIPLLGRTQTWLRGVDA